MDALTSGDAWLDVENSFQFVNSRLEFDPWYALASILALRIVVSIISGVYYFKVYELLSPPASTTEALLKTATNQVWMLYDRGSILVTVRLLILMTG